MSPVPQNHWTVSVPGTGPVCSVVVHCPVSLALPLTGSSAGFGFLVLPSAMKQAETETSSLTV